ncbi:MAG: hypothetical protein HRU35_08330, partial [Rickettsiaceae bacterium]|nr:hypothetical protein [Rickettsiaceae bacterium]
MKIYNFNQIKQAIVLQEDLPKLVESQKKTFIDFSKGEFTVPLPLQLQFDVGGDCHVKAGYKKDTKYFVVKLATGFYNNIAKNLPAGDGIFLILSQDTGLLDTILHDGGFLTTLRTAIAGALAVDITPWKVKNIGIVGTGQLAKNILTIMKFYKPNAKLHLWGRSKSRVNILTKEFQDLYICSGIEELTANCDVIITATASKAPIIKEQYITINRATHIIALGSDEVGKQELEPQLLSRANVIIVDSKKQSAYCGECYYAISKGNILSQNLLELGKVLSDKLSTDNKLIITDLTGI